MFCQALNARNLALAPWCGVTDCEEDIKQRSGEAATNVDVSAQSIISRRNFSILVSQYRRMQMTIKKEKSSREQLSPSACLSNSPISLLARSYTFFLSRKPKSPQFDQFFSGLCWLLQGIYLLVPFWQILLTRAQRRRLLLRGSNQNM